ncbi:uncharacterized protein [Argopecten irradians]|uniref:uncharacterized protein n=1 Tax=Argopecten irradians TaxID=31199 RepID=UPI00371EA186
MSTDDTEQRLSQYISNASRSKSLDNLRCDTCHYTTQKAYNLQRHFRTTKHAEMSDLRTSNDNSNHCDMIIEEDEINYQNHHEDFDRGYSHQSESADEDVLDLQEHFNDDVDLHVDNDQSSGEMNPQKNIWQEEMSDWSPFKSKLHFYLCILSSSKTHRISDEILKFILHMLSECGVTDVPVFESIKNFKCGDINQMLQRNTDEKGNVSWQINPMELLRLKLANPVTSKTISRYPTVNSTGQQTGGTKWLEEIQFPWAQVDGVDFLVDMFVSFRDDGDIGNKIGQIATFMDDLQNDILLAKIKVFCFEDHNNQRCLVETDETLNIPLRECEVLRGALSIFRSGEIVNLNEEERNSHPLWNGKPIVTIPVNIFIDDLATNQSRRWLPLHAVQMQVAGLTLDGKQSGQNAQFLSCSNTVGIIDQLAPICDTIEDSKRHGVEMFDATMRKPVIASSHISLVVTDYQMMSLVCNHNGPSATKFCPKCMADKSNPLKKWEMRTTEKTKRTLDRMRIMQNSKSLQKETGIKPYHNPMWDYINPHRDTPIGILHFMYLGLAKHLVKYCYEVLSSEKKELMSIHLDSMDQSDLDYRVSSQSMFTYMNSRQGKDFKAYLQLAPHNFSYVNAERSHVHALSKLALISKHLQNPEYEGICQEIECYLNYIHTNIPGLTKKSKAHLGLHLADDMETHGHPIHFSEDVFEKNHRTIRSGISQQNGHARSRDSALQFAKCELMSHLAAGGFCKVGESWYPPAPNIVETGQRRAVQHFLGNSAYGSQEKNNNIAFNGKNNRWKTFGQVIY